MVLYTLAVDGECLAVVDNASSFLLVRVIGIFFFLTEQFFNCKSSVHCICIEAMLYDFFLNK